MALLFNWDSFQRGERRYNMEKEEALAIVKKTDQYIDFWPDSVELEGSFDAKLLEACLVLVQSGYKGEASEYGD